MASTRSFAIIPPWSWLCDDRRRPRRQALGAGAPGVYVEGARIAALGIRVTRGRAYHGLALNVDMDLAPFAAIDPCGYPGLRVTQTRSIGLAGTPAQIGERLVQSVIAHIENA